MRHGWLCRCGKGCLSLQAEGLLQPPRDLVSHAVGAACPSGCLCLPGGLLSAHKGQCLGESTV